ncbi:hypothetical protein AAG570_006081 [Ranatra chinensis]|uniref:Uncharacterized protein n=1 Tax=Ranatra chinensis TaxID=642074 RepID=A0ABD0XWZ5_9HEMI
MASKRRNMFHKNKTQETTENGKNSEAATVAFPNGRQPLSSLRNLGQNCAVIQHHHVGMKRCTQKLVDIFQSLIKREASGSEQRAPGLRQNLPVTKPKVSAANRPLISLTTGSSPNLEGSVDHNRTLRATEQGTVRQGARNFSFNEAFAKKIDARNKEMEERLKQIKERKTTAANLLNKEIPPSKEELIDELKAFRKVQCPLYGIDDHIEKMEYINQYRLQRELRRERRERL